MEMRALKLTFNVFIKPGFLFLLRHIFIVAKMYLCNKSFSLPIECQNEC